MNSEELFALRESELPRGLITRGPRFASRASNATVVDCDGKEYVDFAGGIGVMNVGHCHPRVVAAVQDQVERFSHTCFHVFMYEPYIALAKRLNEIAPGGFRKKTMLANSGAEANENAVKIARYATGRGALICFEEAFHGRTLLTMTLTSKTMPYKKGFGPFAPEVYRLPYPYCYRCPLNLKYPECGVSCVELVERAFGSQVAAEDVAAVIVEPVLGEGGFAVPPPEYFPRLRQICDEHGILLIADEIQSGFGRTGRMFALENWGVAADLVACAKSLASGYPLSAVIGRAEIMDAPHVGGIGGTYGGNPVACRAALEVLQIIEEEQLLARASEIGDRLRSALQSMQEEFLVIGDVRGLGAMIAAELVTDPASKAPATALTKALVVRAADKGLILLSAGAHGNVVRFLTPLTIGWAELDRGIELLRESLRELIAENRSA
jgi:4-aminobutyrate aminotransferase/(S)-3-amino-2-methylpropionate transaminase